MEDTSSIYPQKPIEFLLKLLLQILLKAALASVFRRWRSLSLRESIFNADLMLQPHHSKSSLPVLSHPLNQGLPTGNNFAASNLNTLTLKRLPPPKPMLEQGESVCILLTPTSAPLALDLLRIVCLTIWFWCLLAVYRLHGIFELK